MLTFPLSPAGHEPGQDPKYRQRIPWVRTDGIIEDVTVTDGHAHLTALHEALTALAEDVPRIDALLR